MYLLTIFVPILSLFIISLIFNMISSLYSLFLLYFSFFAAFIVSIYIVYEVKFLKQIFSIVSVFLSDMWNFSKFYISFFLGIIFGIYYFKNVGWYAAGEGDIAFFNEPIVISKDSAILNFNDVKELSSSEMKFAILDEALRSVELYFIASFFQEISELNLLKDVQSRLITLDIDSIPLDTLSALFNKFFDSLKLANHTSYCGGKLVLPYKEYYNSSLDFKVNVLGISSLFINQYTEFVLPIPLNYVNTNLVSIILEKFTIEDKLIIETNNTMNEDYKIKYFDLEKKYKFLSEKHSNLSCLYDDAKNSLIILKEDISRISLENKELSSFNKNFNSKNTELKKMNTGLSNFNKSLWIENGDLKTLKDNLISVNETLRLSNESLSSDNQAFRVENEELREKLNRGFFSNFFNFVPKFNFFPNILHNIYTINHSIMENFRGFFNFFRR